MRDKPAECFQSGCPLAVTCQCTHHVDMHPSDSNCTFVSDAGVPCPCNVFRSKGKGFVLGVGDPTAAKYAFVFEAPGKDEVGFRVAPVKGRSFLETPEETEAELTRRAEAYPDLELKFRRTGVPVVGATGVELEMWVFPKTGITRKELFIDNTLRCLPPKTSKGAYPTGDERKMAEKCCRQYDRLDQFKPDVALVTLHPAGILREITPLPLQIKDAERARDFANSGKRPIVLLGGKAVHAFLRYGENVTKWRGHYELLGPDWVNTYKANFEFKAKVKRKPGPKVGAKAARKVAESFATLDHLFEMGPRLEKTIGRGRKRAKKEE